MPTPSRAEILYASPATTRLATYVGNVGHPEPHRLDTDVAKIEYKRRKKLDTIDAKIGHWLNSPQEVYGVSKESGAAEGIALFIDSISY